MSAVRAGMIPLPRPEAAQLTEADAAGIADLFTRCSIFFLLQDGEPPTLSDARGLFTDVPPAKTAADQTVMGWRGGAGSIDALAAILCDYPNKGIWYLGLLIVDPALRGQGFGRAIYAAVEGSAEAGGATEIPLAVLESNEAAGRFWRSLGFTEFRRAGPRTFKARTHHCVEFRRMLARASAVCSRER